MGDDGGEGFNNSSSGWLVGSGGLHAKKDVKKGIKIISH